MISMRHAKVLSGDLQIGRYDLYSMQIPQKFRTMSKYARMLRSGSQMNLCKNIRAGDGYEQ